MQWTGGRNLSQYQKGSNTYSYAYNANSLRTLKTVNGVTTEYYLDGSKIIAMQTGEGAEGLLKYYYDADGTRLAVESNGKVYYYKYNTTGDVISLMDEDFNDIAYYSYNAYGKPESVTDASGNDISQNSEHIANKNPFRYRGYYYDSETGLYYLQSRYYDPEIGRFINADGELNNDIFGSNLFAYCINNPINMIDSCGNWPKWVTGITNVISGAFQMAAAAVVGITAGWTGVGAAVAGVLVVNGSATITQGIGQIVNDTTKSNVLREDNVIRTGAKKIGQAIGGKKGAKIAGGIYDATVTAANIYAGKVGLQQAGKLPIKVNINNVVNNPLDEFVTIGPADGVIQKYCRTIPRYGYGKIYATQLGNGLYQIANGHHRVAALRALGYETIKIFLTK